MTSWKAEKSEYLQIFSATDQEESIPKVGKTCGKSLMPKLS
jgi:hypothetical protein